MTINNIAIEIEGIDKAGKDTILNNIAIIGNYKYTLNSRGILSQLVYNEKFNRNYDYILTYKPFIIFLDVDEQDWITRCKITGEKKIDYSLDRSIFLKYINILKEKGITIYMYNTSKMTPYQIAIDVLSKLEKVKFKDFLCKEEIIFN